MRPAQTLLAAMAALGLAALSIGCGSTEPEAPVASCGVTIDPSGAADGHARAAVITSLGFTRVDEMGNAPGFDLDGQVSDGQDAASCFKVDLVDPDGKKGIDNQLAVLLPDVEKVLGNAVDGLIQGAIDNGDLLILLELDGAEDTKDDACVNLRVLMGKKVRPSLGTNGVIEAYQTFDLDPEGEESRADGAKIEGSVMRTKPFALAVPIAIFDVSFTLHITGSMFRFTIRDDGVYTGYFGGGVNVAELLDGVKEGAGVDQYLPLMKLVLGGAADMARDDAENKCKEVSAALSFQAVPAFIRR